MAKSASHIPPASPDQWINVALRELDNIKGSYLGKLSNDNKVEHSLKATEAVLKAMSWKHNRWSMWPNNQKPYKFLYSHNYEAMLDSTGIPRVILRLSAEHWASWSVLVNAALKQSRYSPTVPSDDEANEVVRSARHPD